MPPDVLIHGDTHRSAALRHELPLGILDPFSYFELNGRRVAVISSMEAGPGPRGGPGRRGDRPVRARARRADRARHALGRASSPSCAPARPQRLGRRAGSWCRASCRWPWPTGCAPTASRSSPTSASSSGGGARRPRRGRRRAPRPGRRRRRHGRRGRAAAAAGPGRRAHHDGEALTSEAVRARIREVCAEHGAPGRARTSSSPPARPAPRGHEHGHRPAAAGRADHHRHLAARRARRAASPT